MQCENYFFTNDFMKLFQSQFVIPGLFLKKANEIPSSMPVKHISPVK